MTLAHFALALDAGTGKIDGASIGEVAGLGQEDPRIIVVKIIRIFLGFLGIIVIGLVMYAGWLWMTSDGEEDKIEKAKLILKNALIGLIIILSSFAIVSFILNRLIGTTAGNGSVGGGPGVGGGGIAALGSGIINSHYPSRNQKDVPRNTSITITFKEPINPATIITGDKINSQNIRIYKTSDGLNGPQISDVKASKSLDNKTFIFKPVQYLGNSKDKIWYTVALSKNIKKVTSNNPAFGGALTPYPYNWTFEVNTVVDAIPPQVLSIIPQPSAVEPRNVVIQVNFNEAVNPLSASGATKNGFNNIIVNATTINNNVMVAGSFYLSNQYKTVEFLTEDKCGVNSCGLDVYCLPGNKDLSVLVKAATLAVVGESSANFPYTGVVDMADNSLDGNKNNIAQGPKSQSNLEYYNENNPNAITQGDDYMLSFKTSDAIDTSPPEIIRIAPDKSSSGISLSADVEAEFNKLIMSDSLNSSNLKLISTPVINYWISKNDNASTSKTTVIFNHDQFNENSSYSPEINSGIKDIYQNCYFPCSGLGVAGNPSCCNGTAIASSSCQ